MSITTTTGDGGQTSLYSGERVWKDDLRVQAYGALDELDAWLGDAKHQVQDSQILTIVEEVQKNLYRAMGQLASTDSHHPLAITSEDVDAITARISSLEELTPLKGFVIPGSLPSSARLDICRTVARRAERHVVSLSRVVELPQELLKYVNRLSDLLFILARSLEARAGAIRYVRSPDPPS